METGRRPCSPPTPCNLKVALRVRGVGLAASCGTRKTRSPKTGGATLAGTTDDDMLELPDAMHNTLRMQQHAEG